MSIYYIFTFVAGFIWIMVLTLLAIAIFVDPAAINGVVGGGIAAIPYTIIAVMEIRENRRGYR